MSLIPEYDLSLEDARTGDVLGIVRLSLVPRVGEEVWLPPRKRGVDAGGYRVVRVRYELADRQRLILGHLSSVTLCLEPLDRGR